VIPKTKTPMEKRRNRPVTIRKPISIYGKTTLCSAQDRRPEATARSKPQS